MKKRTQDNQLKSLLKDLKHYKYERNNSVEELFKSTLNSMDDRNITKLTDGGITHTFDLSSENSFDSVNNFIGGVNVYSNKMSFILYEVWPTDFNHLKSTYITFFKPSDKSKFIDLINSAIVSKVLNS